jgi:hypothetical protein
MDHFQAQRTHAPRVLPEHGSCATALPAKDVSLAAPIRSRKKITGRPPRLAKVASGGVVAQETSGSDGIAADHNRFRVRFYRTKSFRDNPEICRRFAADRLEKVRGDERRRAAFHSLVPAGRAGFGSFPGVHSQRQLVFCQNFPLRVVIYDGGFAGRPIP